MADVENIGVDELQNASDALNSSITIITEAEPYFFLLPEELKQGIQLFKAQITDVATAADTAKASVENAVTAVGAATKARAAADAAKLLYANVLSLVNTFGKIPGKTQAVGVNIGKILTAIKSINQTAEIYVMGYYNALPYVDTTVTAPLLQGLNQQSRYLRVWPVRPSFLPPICLKKIIILFLTHITFIRMRLDMRPFLAYSWEK